MAVTLDNINALFKQRFGEGPKETLEDKPYFIKIAKTVQISRRYTVPVNLRPGHSMIYSGDAYEKVTYKDYESPELRDAEGRITAKFFKVEVPLGIIDSLNKTADNNSLAYDTAGYFIDDALRVNQLLAELSYMYGENGLPLFTSKTPTGNFNGVALETNQFVMGFEAGKTSKQILRLMLNSKITIGTGTAVYTVVNISTTGDSLLLQASSAGDVTAAASSGQAYIESQKDNDCFGLYQLMNSTGIVLGIDGSQYHNWRGNTQDCGNARLTIAKVKEYASSLITSGGIMNEDLCLFVSQESWDNISAEIDAGRQFDQSYKMDKNVTGQRKVGIMHSNGMIEIKYHPLMKRDTAFLMTDPANKKNLITLTNGQVMSFENNKRFMSAENSSSAYMIGKMYFAPFMRDRRRHAVITNIDNA